MSIADSATPAAHSQIDVYPSAPLTQIDAIAFIQRIISHGAASTSHATRLSDRPAPLDQPSGAANRSQRYIPWTIRTKYYEADVHFHLQLDDEATGQPARGAGRAVPAVIVLAQATSVPSEAVASRLAHLAAPESGPDVCLLATVPASPIPGNLAQSSNDEWESLAFEHGFELVHFSGASKDNEEVYLSDPRGENGDKEGVEQVVDALHAHMWEGLRRLDTRNAPVRSLVQRGIEVEEEDSLLPPRPALVAPPPATTSGIPPACSSAQPRPRSPSADLDPISWSFPSTFLPSIPRTTRQNGSTASAPRDENDASVFDDNFSPFLSGPSLNPEAPSARNFAASATAETAFAEPSVPLSAGLATDADGDDLDALFAKVSLARKEAEGMGLEARRQFAAQMVRDLLGEDAGLDDISDEEG
ncbi:hypothetical protein JCM10908_000369 [Rhodotorula pacifica]|uniref:uncharacterized protein n=1 Tax=Rhodotorula pacifica TaxID=1495444 RepID=UPI0031780094